jgi:hypothetical protein
VGEAVLEYARQIPTARDFFENALRGYHDARVGAGAGEAARHEPEDSLVIYQNQGRPMNIRQITQALSRGGEFNPEPGELTDPYEASVVEGNVKPGYYELAKALKYTLPSPFVMRQLTESGVWTEAKAAKRLKDIGWIPEDADEAAKAWARRRRAARSRGRPRRKRTSGRALTIRKQLTITDLKRDLQEARAELATGNLWTRDEVLTAVVNRGYSLNDATSLIETWNAYGAIGTGPNFLIREPAPVVSKGLEAAGVTSCA